MADDRTTNEAQAGLPGVLPSKQSGESSRSDRDLAYCLRRAQTMFACYRRDDATNPEVYCAAVASVLSEYKPVVVDYVTDPRTGIPSDQKFLPSVAEVREACNRRTEQMARLAQPPRYKTNRPYAPEPKFPGCRENLLVLFEAPQYPTVKALIESGQLDECDWLNDPRGVRIGLHVFHNLHSRDINLGPDGKTRQIAPTDAELRAMYGKREADFAGKPLR